MYVVEFTIWCCINILWGHIILQTYNLPFIYFRKWLKDRRQKPYRLFLNSTVRQYSIPNGCHINFRITSFLNNFRNANYLIGFVSEVNASDRPMFERSLLSWWAFPIIYDVLRTKWWIEKTVNYCTLTIVIYEKCMFIYMSHFCCVHSWSRGSEKEGRGGDQTVKAADFG